ncbi:tRNA-dihydrouridine(20) synthase [NAD(P)(+)] [Malassezia cuniculi]|uniref:tRNA-dihydrouridine(20) synthase [NAD(P)(+)] n=1 Tax=Malassezia cuniculi TaxID=948313 RepID=A0AAF0ESE0_9BASI|nr:tRNA-dihydrouridine(20) synthase [NAD(P)(+)] [Malassezia cuniculi]
MSNAETLRCAKRQRVDMSVADEGADGNLSVKDDASGSNASAAIADTPLFPASDPRMPDFSRGMFLAPMVRVGSLPTRLLSLQYGADLVWGPEVVDRAIIGTNRVVRDTGLVEYIKDDKQIFSCHPVERPYLIYQLGSASPDLAYQAVSHVTQHDDVAGVDLNCGCPKPFSTLGGMGANLLTTPDLLCDILRAMRRAAPPHVSVTCKIRLLPTDEATHALVEQIVRTRTVRAITIHCRTKEMRPREPALIHRFKSTAEHIAKIAQETGQSVPVVYNGDCFGSEEVERIRNLTGASAVMMARAAEANPSCFAAQRECAATVIGPQWLRYAVWSNNPFGNTKYCVTLLAFTPSAGASVAFANASSATGGGSHEGAAAPQVSPLGKKELKQMRSMLSTTKSNEDMFRALNMPWPLDLNDNDILHPLRSALEERNSAEHMK